MTSIPHRPPRLTRLFSTVRPFYFVNFNTHRRKAMLACDAAHEAFRHYCVQAMERGVAVGRYVIMPDHLHLFVALPPDGVTLAGWVRTLKTVLGKTLLRLGHDQPHWQEGFFNHVLRSGESYAQKWAYVRENPVRAELVNSPEAWKYQGEIEVIQF